MSSIICSVYGCHNNWKKRRISLEQHCIEHDRKRAECCGPRFNLYPPPSKKEDLRLWLKALNLKYPPKRPYVCSFHFVEGKPTPEHPYPEKWLGYIPPVKWTRRWHVKSPEASNSTVVVKTETDEPMPVTHCDASTQSEDPSVSEHNYASSSPPFLPLLCDKATQHTEPAHMHTTLLRTDDLCMLYTGLPLKLFNSLADHLTQDYNNRFQLHPRDQLLMTLMKLRLNLLQADIAERFRVSQPIVSRVTSCWLDLMEEKMRCFIPWLPSEKIQATMPQCFKEHYPKTTCVIDCSETPLQKLHNLNPSSESCSHSYGQNTIKYLVATAPCGQIMFISAAYEDRCSEEFIIANSGLLEYLRPDDEVMAHRQFLIQDLLSERNVKLILPASTKKGKQRIANVRVYFERVIWRLKNFRIISQAVPNTLMPKFDKILRVCAALCNLHFEVNHDTEGKD